MPLVGEPTSWAADTQQGVILSALFDHASGDGRHSADCAICKRAARSLVDQLGEGALRFYRNPTVAEKAAGQTGRVELPRGKARFDRLKWKVAEVHAYASDYVPGDPAQPEPVVVADPKPVRTGFDVDAEKALFMAEMRRLRPFAEEREIDHISYRPAKDARRMIEAGIPARACLHAMTLHWEDATRAQARVADYDPATDFPGGLDAYLDALASARVLLMLTGPAGMGKSYWAQNLADRLDLQYGSIPMTEGATPSWILGAQRLNGFGESRFLQIWRDGGVFLLDELDAADPNMLLVVNDALANGVLHNPVNGESYERHPDCILIAATNTLGTGADASYTGRNQLDFSTLDRWRMGRAFVGYRAEVEDAVMYA
jgi:hypothetical protein